MSSKVKGTGGRKNHKVPQVAFATAVRMANDNQGGRANLIEWKGLRLSRLARQHNVGDVGDGGDNQQNNVERVDPRLVKHLELGVVVLQGDDVFTALVEAIPRPIILLLTTIASDA